jgi:peptidyl-tRNA hydrolase, PTH1 family
MKLIVGLGNPGVPYENSRHNVGFCVADLLARRWCIELSRHKHQAQCGSGVYRGESVLLLKPQTFMNRSGGSVAEAVAFYKLPLSDLLVIVDDMALDVGALRLRGGGSAGGHHGLQDVIDQLGSEEVARLRVGIGAPAHRDAVNHVLGTFGGDEKAVMEAALARAADAVECWVHDGLPVAMNRYNTRKKTEDGRQKTENGK